MMLLFWLTEYKWISSMTIHLEVPLNKASFWKLILIVKYPRRKWYTRMNRMEPRQSPWKMLCFIFLNKSLASAPVTSSIYRYWVPTVVLGNMLTYFINVSLFNPQSNCKVILVIMMMMSLIAAQIYRVPTMCLMLFQVICI